MSLDAYFQDQLKSREEKGTRRKLRINNPTLIDFTSNDYLGLARSRDLQNRINIVTEKALVTNGATGSRLLSGNSLQYEALENELAVIFKAESCLVFNSGYSANMGVLSSVPSRHDTILFDERCHASIKDGIRLSMAVRHPFLHNDLNDLEKKIQKSKGKTFIVVESIYSMDGDVCPLSDLVTLAEKHNCYIILDEAHSTGIIGTSGAGLAVSLGLSEKISIRIYTFGKAIGAHGACVAGTKHLTDFLVNFSRQFIYTTALTPHTIHTIHQTFLYLKENPMLQTSLNNNIRLFLAKFENGIFTSTSPIQTVVLGNVKQTKAMAQRLAEKGFDIRPIFSPTVADGEERVRICLHTFNSQEEIINLTSALKIK